ncbi:MAG: A24 family peptidase [Bryobacteraceae bacterium]
MTPVTALAVLVGLAASIQDLAVRRISNWIPLIAILGGLAIQTVQHGWRGAAGAVLGAITGFCIFLLLYVMGGMGGGDVKLMAGFGALLGVSRLLEAALWTAVCGGVLAVGVVVWVTVRNRIRGEVGKPLTAEAIPYAPAIAVGAWLSLLSTV